VLVRTRWVVGCCCTCVCIVLFVVATCLDMVHSIMVRAVDIGVYYHSYDIINNE
jgi:hypothetical protein